MKHQVTEGWVEKKLGDVLVKTETIDPGKVPDAHFTYIDVSGVNKETKQIENISVLLGKDAPSRARKLIRSNDVIFATVRPTHSRVALITDEYDGQVCSTGYFVLRGKDFILNKYLFYFLLTNEFNTQMEKLQKGASYPAVTDAEVKSVFVRFPKSIQEQQRIVAILDEAFAAIDKAKSNAERNLKNARELFESYLRKVFEEGQIETTIGEQLLLQRGFDITKSEQKAGSVPVVSSGGIKSFHTEAMVAGPGVVIGRKGTLGKVFFLPTAFWPHDTTLWVKDFKGNVPKFVYYFFLSLDVKSLDSGAANPALNRNQVHPIKISWRPIVEQKEISEKLDLFFAESRKLEKVYQRKVSDLDELKKSLLQKAFSGELTASKSIAKVIELPVKYTNISAIDLQAGIVAFALQRHLEANKANTFGHVKAEKIVHLAEQMLNIDLERNPVKDAAGPNDFPHANKVQFRAGKAGFYNVRETEVGYKYTPGNQIQSIISKTQTVLDAKVDRLKWLVDLLIPMTTQQAEIIATVYAAWNNLLLNGKEITDEAIVTEAREDWHPDKLKIERERFFNAIKWMKEVGLVPTGNGKQVLAKAAK